MSRFDRELIRFDWEKRIGWKFAVFEREFFVSSNKIRLSRNKRHAVQLLEKQKSCIATNYYISTYKIRIVFKYQFVIILISRLLWTKSIKFVEYFSIDAEMF